MDSQCALFADILPRFIARNSAICIGIVVKEVININCGFWIYFDGSNILRSDKSIQSSCDTNRIRSAHWEVATTNASDDLIYWSPIAHIF